MIKKISIAASAVVLVLGGCASPPSTNYLEARLVPTTGRTIPAVESTQYDCSIASRSTPPSQLFQANVGGRVLSDNRPYNVTTTACFTTQSECEAYLYMMNGLLEQVITSRCTLGVQKQLFS
ncbi:hypothetical protein [Pseudovibrio sp. SPO723]|uniref:hypothetical protein n=1 Tax=Nesiotobacter zosterae TaxID=392721 RepID=UPI0029C47809|nr:hypothetical protein [Pseudovibrio sp. SPO723]MDX5595623.1 hypothetical protein [Pseudovibrio sp. SPO723]